MGGLIFIPFLERYSILLLFWRDKYGGRYGVDWREI
jgi:hypothetical protein